MAQHEVEIILMRELASKLSSGIFLVDPEGNLLFYNEAAEELLGMRFDETGAMAMADWSEHFTPTDERGETHDPHHLPLGRVVQSRRPAHGSFWIAAQDGSNRFIEVTAFPLIGQADRFLGAAALFWEVARR
jgi:PAS domain S-box-containing protein